MDNGNRFLRQLDLAPPDKLDIPITVIGAGALGSAAVMGLCKMGCSNISVWDDDTVSEHNMPSQFLDWHGEAGTFKVDALQTLLADMQAEPIKRIPERYVETSPVFPGIVLALTDNMESRKLVWENHKDKLSCQWIIDGRMGAQTLRLYTVRPCDPKHQAFYEQNLYTSAEAERLPCSAKAIVFCPLLAGALITRQVKNICMDLPVANEILFDLTAVGMSAYSDYTIV